MRKVVVSQPMYFPWPGFFEQMMLAEAYFWLDDAQFSKGSFTNRIRIGFGGSAKWLSIPLEGGGSFATIGDLKPASDFRSNHLAFLRQAFRDAPFRQDALSIADEVFSHASLCDLLIASAEVPARRLGIAMGQSRARTSRLDAPGQSWRRVLDLVLGVGGTHYLTGHGAANYLDHTAFAQAGVAVEYMSYSMTAWQPPASKPMPNLSILDLIAHKGDEAISHLRPATVGWEDFVGKA